MAGMRSHQSGHTQGSGGRASTRRTMVTLVGVATLVLQLALGRATATAAPVEARLRVFAAASLTDAFREIATAFEGAHPGLAVELNFAGSQLLQTQIEQGAPADVFASADLVHAQALAQQGLLSGYDVFARNAVAVVVPAEGARVSQLSDLARSGVKVVVAGETVPAGRYANQVIASLSASGLFGASFQARVLANVVSREPNVRAVLTKVALGEADAGFVYVTDAQSARGRVRMLAIPEDYAAVGEYPIGLLTRAAAPVSARAFVTFVRGPAGRDVLRKHGFR